jgi:hypothetical protein
MFILDTKNLNTSNIGLITVHFLWSINSRLEVNKVAKELIMNLNQWEKIKI